MDADESGIIIVNENETSKEADGQKGNCGLERRRKFTSNDKVFIDKVNDAIDNEESINNVEYYCGDRNISAYQVEYWYKKYYCCLKYYYKLMTDIIEKKRFQKYNQQFPLLQLEH